MRNVFKIVADGKEYTAYNTVKKAFEYWKNGELYAAYIALFAKDGSSLYKKATLITYNDNVARGKLFATYGVSVKSGEFSKEICAVGFAPQQDAKLSNECKVQIIASEFEIYGTIYLEADEKDFNFYPDNNPLVRSLLGMQTAETLQIKGAKTHLTAQPMLVNVGDYEDVAASSSVCESKFYSGEKTDFLIYCGGKPCARFNCAYFNAKTLQRQSECNGGFFADAIEVCDVTTSVGAKYERYNTVSALYDSGAETKSGFYGYELFCDPLYRYAGLCNGSKYYLIDADTYEVTYGGEYSGKITMCTNGEAVSVDGGTVKFLNSGRSVQVEDNQTAVLYVDDHYEIYVYDGWTMLVYDYDGELKCKKILFTVKNSVMTRLNDYSVLINGESEKVIFKKDGMLSNEFEWLSRADGVNVSDGCGYKDGYIVSLLSGNGTTCQKHSGRFCIKDGALYYVGEGGIVKLKDEFDFDSATIAKNTAVFLKDGTLSFYKTGCGGTFVSVPTSGNVTYTAKTWNDDPVTVTLKLTNKEEL